MNLRVLRRSRALGEPRISLKDLWVRGPKLAACSSCEREERNTSRREYSWNRDGLSGARGPLNPPVSRQDLASRLPCEGGQVYLVAVVEDADESASPPSVAGIGCAAHLTQRPLGPWPKARGRIELPTKVPRHQFTGELLESRTSPPLGRQPRVDEISSAVASPTPSAPSSGWTTPSTRRARGCSTTTGRWTGRRA